MCSLLLQLIISAKEFLRFLSMGPTYLGDLSTLIFYYIQNTGHINHCKIHVIFSYFQWQCGSKRPSNILLLKDNLTIGNLLIYQLHYPQEVPINSLAAFLMFL